jgi:ribosome-associated translation inhibitor RaiA
LEIILADIIMSLKASSAKVMTDQVILIAKVEKSNPFQAIKFFNKLERQMLAFFDS